MTSKTAEQNGQTILDNVKERPDLTSPTYEIMLIFLKMSW